MDCTVPVLLLAFNRPEQTKWVLEHIRQVAPPRLYAHCDGPRLGSATDPAQVDAVRKLIEAPGPGEKTTLKTFFRTENVGLRKGVYEAVNWFFEHEEFGIILEDDCWPDPSFFRFCSELLQRYRENEQIMHIGGSNLSEALCADLQESYVFSKFSFVWGWASWRRAWQHMTIDLNGLEAFERNGGMDRFLSDSMAQTYMLDKFKQTRAGKNNSWAYAWFYSILRNQGLCIVPKVNLIQNTGVGHEDATHTRKQNKQASLRAQTMSFPLVHPDTTQVHDWLERAFFHSTQKSFWRLKLWSLLHAFGLR